MVAKLSILDTYWCPDYTSEMYSNRFSWKVLNFRPNLGRFPNIDPTGNIPSWMKSTWLWNQLGADYQESMKRVNSLDVQLLEKYEQYFVRWRKFCLAKILTHEQFCLWGIWKIETLQLWLLTDTIGTFKY